MRVHSARSARILKRARRVSSGWQRRIRSTTNLLSVAVNGRTIRITIRPRRRWMVIGKTGIQSRFGFHQKLGWGLEKYLKWRTRFMERSCTGGETMATTLDQIRRYKEGTLDDLKETGERLFRLGYNKAKLEAEEALKAREETAEWMDATDDDKKRYKEGYHCIDELAYWCSACKSPLSGHWASVKWWLYCPWCGRKLIREVQNG